jgi:antagonist of KipI
MHVEVIEGGLLTTVQDRGRHGWRHLGVGCAGAADAYSAAVANLLVGNPPDAALLEATLRGPTLRFERAATIALCGADMAADVDGTPVAPWRRIALADGATLHLRNAQRGTRLYLAIDGGIAVAPVLGSRSTDLRAGFGGHRGRALRAGDRLPLGDATQPPRATLQQADAWFDPSPDLTFAPHVNLRVLPGSARSGCEALIAAPDWEVAPASNRQGVRLLGAALTTGFAADARSEPVLPGTVQVPPDGRPIVLLCDAQTVGGYARVAHVIEADLPRLAQCQPGDRVRFALVDEDAAFTLRRVQTQRLARLAVALRR